MEIRCWSVRTFRLLYTFTVQHVQGSGEVHAVHLLFIQKLYQAQPIQEKKKCKSELRAAVCTKEGVLIYQSGSGGSGGGVGGGA